MLSLIRYLMRAGYRPTFVLLELRWYEALNLYIFIRRDLKSVQRYRSNLQSTYSSIPGRCSSVVLFKSCLRCARGVRWCRSRTNVHEMVGGSIRMLYDFTVPTFFKLGLFSFILMFLVPSILCFLPQTLLAFLVPFSARAQKTCTAL